MSRLRGSRRFAPTVQGLEFRLVLSATATAWVAPPASERLATEVDVASTPLGGFAAGQTYQGMIGGSYESGGNIPSESLAAAVESAASRVQPIAGRGRAGASGRIGVVTIGQSTTEQWFSKFMQSARGRRGELREGVFFVNGGQPGMISTDWAGGSQTWATLARQVGRGRSQIQVAFLDTAMIFGERLGGAEAQAARYSEQLTTIVHRAKREFPNLKLVYVFPFHWAGAAYGRSISEPGGYDMQFGVRRMILSQDLSDPVAVWGPDVWSQTQDPALYSDGIHWSGAGRSVMTQLTWRFLEQDPAAADWLWR